MAMLKLDQSFKSKVDSVIDDLDKMPLIGGIVEVIENTSVRITNLGINTKTGEYSFGAGLDFTKTPFHSKQGLSLDAIGFQVNYNKEKDKPKGNE